MNAYMKKAWYYCRRNGVSRTFFAALERILQINNIRYEYKPLSEAEKKAQSERSFSEEITFSILVPAYETDPHFLHQMIDSLMQQTYRRWELVIADASRTDGVERIAADYIAGLEGQAERRIVYKRLQENAGISANTNEALRLATGKYIGLLDHDDVLTPDALYEMALRIHVAAEKGRTVGMLYSDEDKCDAQMTRFYEPHFKEKFNLDLILSNNYICHFLVMRADLMKQLQFQPAFDGAQDYKLVLDAVSRLMQEPEMQIVHVPKVLYHWRCHTDSTASNPRSKLYAYEAGRNAVDSFCRKQGWTGVRVEHLPHLGFYRLVYAGNEGVRNIFCVRKDVGAVGGSVLHHGRIVGGRYLQNGGVCCKGLYHRFSGYMHRAVLVQEAWALDIRGIVVREELQPILKEIKCKYNLSTNIRQKLPETLIREASMEFADAVKQRGYRLIWDPILKITNGIL